MGTVEPSYDLVPANVVSLADGIVKGMLSFWNYFTVSLTEYNDRNIAVMAPSELLYNRSYMSMLRVAS